MKRILFAIILLSFFIPILQESIRIVDFQPLNGHIELSIKSEVTLDGWFSGDFQSQYNDYFNDNLGFRPFFIRGFNQIQLDLFDKLNSTVKGSDDVLYDVRYIKTKLGEDFLGRETIKKKVENLETLKKQLESVNKKLLIVITPNKARYYEEELPKYYKGVDSTNYEIFIELFNELKIDFLDFNSWFIDQKEINKLKLIPKYGIHWSNYGSFLAADSIIKYCNTKYQFSLPKFQLDSLVSTKIPRKPDYDMGETLNLFTLLDDENYLYPEYTVVKDSASKKKNLLVISDSFFDQIYSTKFSSEVFSSTCYWYYNREVREDNKRERKDDDLEKVLPKTDLVIIMMTEWNLYRFGFGIVEEMNSFYSGTEIESQEVRLYIDRIRSDKEWFKEIGKQAKERKISVDSMLVKAARFMIKEKK